MSQQMTRILGLAMMTIFLFIFYLYANGKYDLLDVNLSPSDPRNPNIPQPTTANLTVLDTPGCKIPYTDQFPNSFVVRLIIKVLFPKQNCNVPQLVYMEGNILKLNHPQLKKWENVKCGYRSFILKQTVGGHQPFARKESFYAGVKPKIHEIKNDTVITDEFVRVQCKQNDKLIHQDFFPVIVRKLQVEARCKKALEKYKNEQKLSVLLLGLDSVSKNQYRRSLHLVDEFIRKNFLFAEFHGYHKVSQNTFPNMVAFLTGHSTRDFKTNFRDRYADFLPFIWKNFAKKGYRTLFVEDNTEDAMFDYSKKGFYKRPTDYFFRPFSFAAEKAKLMGEGVTKSGCYPNRTETSVILKWTEDFFDEFKGDPLFALVFLSRVTHDNPKGAEYQDKPLFDFLKRLKKSGHLNETIVFFFSDHGFRTGVAKLRYAAFTEEKLPFGFIILPDWFWNKYPGHYTNLKLNENRLVTAFDMHATLMDICSSFTNVGRFSPDDRSVSLFMPVSADRNCDIAGIESLYCTCIERHQVSVRDKRVRKASDFLVKFINDTLDKYKHLCALYRLHKIIEASAKNILHNDQTFTISYKLTIQVNPSQAVFQGIVKLKEADGRYNVEPFVDRIDKYGNQSFCVDYVELKPLCYCLPFLT